MIARNNYSYGEELYNGSFVRVDEVMNGGQIEHRQVKLHRENKQEVEVDLQFGEAKISFRKGNEAVTMVVKLLVNSLNTTDTSVSGKAPGASSARGVQIATPSKTTKPQKDKSTI